jgi:CHAD domain-containing protein
VPAHAHDADRSGADVLRGVLVDGMARLDRHDAPLRAGDVEGVHQTRVAVRRLRSHLRTFRTLIDSAWAATTYAGLADFADALGAVRDLDVVHASLEADAADLHPVVGPLLGDIEARRDARFADLLARLVSPEHQSMIERMRLAADEPRLEAIAVGPGCTVLADPTRRAWRRLKRRVDRLGGERAGPEQLHAIRIRAKHARYALETLASLHGRSDDAGLDAAAKQVAEIQRVLGRVQDAAIARRQILMASARRPGDGTFGLAAGVLLERQATRSEAAQEEFAVAWHEARRARIGRLLRRCP